ncbi:MAG: hypothetical protein WAW02_10910 [Sideroxyarcus sp.]
MDLPPGLDGILGQPNQIAAVILIGEKTWLAIVATLDQVDGDIG